MQNLNTQQAVIGVGDRVRATWGGPQPIWYCGTIARITRQGYQIAVTEVRGETRYRPKLLRVTYREIARGAARIEHASDDRRAESEPPLPASALRMYPGCGVLRVDGRSMEPTLFDRDVVLVDSSQKNPASGTVTAVCVRGRGRLVGRLCYSRRGYWLAKDNPNVCGNAVFIGGADAFAVIGVVMAVAQRFDVQRDLPTLYTRPLVVR